MTRVVAVVEKWEVPRQLFGIVRLRLGSEEET